MGGIRDLLTELRSWFRRRRFREGSVVSRFVARDVLREIEIVSAAKLDDGIITGRVRTTNLLYRSKGLVPQTEFGSAQDLRIEELWHWTGKDWGGLPDGTSIVDDPRGEPRSGGREE